MKVGFTESRTPPALAILDQVLTCAAIGSPATASAAVEAFVESTGADELMVTSQIYDHAARRRSYALLREAVGAPRTADAIMPA